MTVPAHGTDQTAAADPIGQAATVPAYAPAPATPVGGPPAPAAPPADYTDPGPQHTAPAPTPAPTYRQVDRDAYEKAADRARAAAAAQVRLDRPDPGPTDPAHLPDVRAEVATEAGEQDPAVIDQADDRPDDAPELDLSNLPDGAIVVPLRGRFGAGVVAVLAYDDWPSDANSDMRVGDYESWAEGCLAEGHYDEWQRIGPRNRDVAEMFEHYRRLTGQDSGKSSGSMRSYRNSGRRSKRT
jgi:hypothetical protein